MVTIGASPDTQREIERAESIADESVSMCMQCGVCSASCPNAEEMDLSPRAVIHLVQLGLLDRALDSSTIWTCSSCLQCTARCPRGIDLTRTMEALRLLRLRSRLGRLAPAELGDSACADAPPILLASAMRKLTG